MLSLKHCLAQPFFLLLRFFSPFVDLLKHLCASRTIVESWGASWSILRQQNWAWDKVNVNTRTTHRPAWGQAANACVVNVEETLAKSSLDLQIPRAVLLLGHTGAAHLLLSLPMSLIRWWRRSGRRFCSVTRGYQWALLSGVGAL